MAMRKHSCRAGGFTMIEVLVALAVVAFGLLGLAKLQAVAISSAKVASSRTIAANLTEGIASAMHADTAYWQTAAAATASPITVTYSATSPTVSLGSLTNCQTTTCTPVQMATFDLTNFGIQVATQLPAPVATATKPVSISCTTGSATYFSSNPNQCTITISWSEQYTTTAATSASAPMPATQTYVMLVQP